MTTPEIVRRPMVCPNAPVAPGRRMREEVEHDSDDEEIAKKKARASDDANTIAEEDACTLADATADAAADAALLGAESATIDVADATTNKENIGVDDADGANDANNGNANIATRDGEAADEAADEVVEQETKDVHEVKHDA